jgi:hypothetical protein
VKTDSTTLAKYTDAMVQKERDNSIPKKLPSFDFGRKIDKPAWNYRSQK